MLLHIPFLCSHHQWQQHFHQNMSSLHSLIYLHRQDYVNNRCLQHLNHLFQTLPASKPMPYTETQNNNESNILHLKTREDGLKEILIGPYPSTCCNYKRLIADSFSRGCKQCLPSHISRYHSCSKNKFNT